MASSTILRVKRRLEHNPQDALVLLCKRKKTNSEEISPSLFVFRGSVDKQESANFKSITPCSNKLKQTSNVNDIINKIRQERKDFASENRYEIVNCSRGLKEESSESDKHYDLVDLQRKEDEKDDVEFLYDLYTAAKEDFDISMLDDLVGIEHLESELIFGSNRDNGLLQSDDEEDEDDSNAENDYRNEYPDSEASSVDEADMITAMQRCDLADSLSSDTGEDKIYDEPPDLCNEDVKRYGEAYAKYKAKVLGEETDLSDSRNFVHCVKIKEVEDSYKDDSDDGFYYGQEEDDKQFQEQYRGDSSEYEPD